LAEIGSSESGHHVETFAPQQKSPFTAARAKIRADRCWQAMAADELTSSADLLLRNVTFRQRPPCTGGDDPACLGLVQALWFAPVQETAR
jgi:hypothetical protein